MSEKNRASMVTRRVAHNVQEFLKSAQRSDAYAYDKEAPKGLDMHEYGAKVTGVDPPKIYASAYGGMGKYKEQLDAARIYRQKNPVGSSPFLMPSLKSEQFKRPVTFQTSGWASSDPKSRTIQYASPYLGGQNVGGGMYGKIMPEMTDEAKDISRERLVDIKAHEMSHLRQPDAFVDYFYGQYPNMRPSEEYMSRLTPEQRMGRVEEDAQTTIQSRLQGLKRKWQAGDIHGGNYFHHMGQLYDEAEAKQGYGLAFDMDTLDKVQEAMYVPGEYNDTEARNLRAQVGHILKREEAAPQSATINQFASRQGWDMPRTPQEAYQTWIKAHEYAKEHPNEFKGGGGGAPIFFLDPRKLPENVRNAYTRMIPGLVRRDQHSPYGTGQAKTARVAHNVQEFLKVAQSQQTTI